MTHTESAAYRHLTANELQRWRDGVGLTIRLFQLTEEFMDRRNIAALSATTTIILAALTFPGAASAQASVNLVTCPLGSQTTTYAPGLKLASPAPNVSLKSAGNLGPCVALDLQHTSASYTFNGTGQLNCLGGNSAGIGKIDWTDPGTTPSTYSYTAGISLRPDGVTVLVFTGTITSGDYTGQSLLSTVVLASTDLTACLSPSGLTSVSGPFTLSIL